MLRAKRIMTTITARGKSFEAGKVTRSEPGPPYKLNEDRTEKRIVPWRILTQYRSRFSRTRSSRARKRWESSSENLASPRISKREEITLALSSTLQDS